jgi:hypothetical protein
VIMEEKIDAKTRRFRKGSKRHTAVLQDAARRTGPSETDEKNGSNIASNEINGEYISCHRLTLWRSGQHGVGVGSPTLVPHVQLSSEDCSHSY